jgi:hypothetical protein
MPAQLPAIRINLADDQRLGAVYGVASWRLAGSGSPPAVFGLIKPFADTAHCTAKNNVNNNCASWELSIATKDVQSLQAGYLAGAGGQGVTVGGLPLRLKIAPPVRSASTQCLLERSILDKCAPKVLIMCSIRNNS